MPVEVVHTFEEEGKPVNVATLLQCAPAEFVFNVRNARVSAPFLSYVPCPFVFNTLKHLDSVCLVSVPGNASVFQCWADKACVYLFSEVSLVKFFLTILRVLVPLALTFCTWSFHDSLLSNSTPR